MRIDDNAIDIYKTGSIRAHRLARLYHGLVNQRRRAMREDWARSLDKFMGWSAGTANARVDGNEAMVIIKTEADLTYADFETDALKDILRSSLMLSVSAMDAYYHRKIKCYAVRLAKLGDKAPGKLQALPIAVRDFSRGMDRSRKWSALSTAIDTKLSYQSMQSPAKIADALSLLGIKSFWKTIAPALGYDPDKLRTDLQWIVDRRNLIAHQADISVAKKNFGKDINLEPGKVYWAIEFIDDLVEQADIVINAHLETQ